MRRIGIFSICMLISTITAWGYDPPVGIPDPYLSWGGIQNPVDDIPPARPSTWTGEIPGYYYIDAGVGCSDLREYGYPAAPRCSIKRPTPAGSYVEVHGIYNITSGGTIQFYGTGSSDAWVANTSGPVWIVGQNGQEPTVTGAMSMVYGTYVYIYNLRFSGNPTGNIIQISSGSIGYGANNIVVKNCDIEGTVTSNYGLDARANVLSPVSNVLYYNNNIHDHGPSYDIDKDSHMVNVGSNVSKVWILNNTLNNSSGSGMQFGASSPGPRNVYVGNNSVNNSRQSGIWVKYGTDIIISTNTVHDVKDRCVGADTSPSKGLGGQYSPNNVWWINNTIYNCRYGIRVASTDSGQGEVYAIGNLLYDINISPSACFNYPTGNNTWDMAAIHFHGAVTKWAVNNTIYNVASGIHDSNASNGGVFYNNIISNISHPNGYILYSETTAKTTFDYNILYGASPYVVRWGASGTKYTSLSAFSTSTGQGSHSRQVDPLMISPGAHNFSLTSSSPAIDSGTASSVYDTFYRRYGISIAKDKAGKVRYQGRNWDIGAYEFPGSLKAPFAPIIRDIR